MEENRTIQLLEEIKQLLGHTKKVMNVDDLESIPDFQKAKFISLRN